MYNPTKTACGDDENTQKISWDVFLRFKGQRGFWKVQAVKISFLIYNFQKSYKNLYSKSEAELYIKLKELYLKAGVQKSCKIKITSELKTAEGNPLPFCFQV